MKKHLSLLFALLISACSGPVGSTTSNLSSEPVVSSSEETTTSNVESTSTSTTSVISSTSASSSTSSSVTTSSSTSSSSSTFSSISSSSSSSTSSSTSNPSSASSSSVSTSTSAPSSSSSSSSSSQGEKELSSLEAFELFFEKLTLKNSTFFVEDYIEEKMIGDEILFNQYYGRFAEYYNDEGYFVYLDQGIYYYEVDEENNITIGDCQTLNKNSTISEFFQTPYDFYNLRKEWKVTDEDFVFVTTNRYVGEIINELGGNGIFNGEYVAKSYQNELRVASDGLSATFVSTITTNGYGDVTSTVLVKDLGTTTCPLVEQFLNEANPLVSTNDFPSSVKNGLREMFGDDVPVPEGASYAYGTEVFTSEGQVVDITYKDYLIGDQVASYREALEQYGFTLSSKTDEKGDLKQYGYVNWYYEITIDSNYYLVHLFFYPKMYLGQYEQGMYPNGIFSVRFRTY